MTTEESQNSIAECDPGSLARPSSNRIIKTPNPPIIPIMEYPSQI